MKKYLAYILISALIIASVLYWNKDSETPLFFGAIGTPTTLTNGQDIDGTSAAATASVSPTGNRLELLTVTSRTGISTEPNEPTITGNGLTWVKVDGVYWDTTSGSRKKTTVFRAMGASPSAGTIAIDFGGQAQTDVIWSLVEFDGVDTSGTNGSGAIVQTATNSDGSATVSTITATLAAFSSVNNATFGAFGYSSASNNMTVGSGFTESSDDWTTGNQTENFTEYKLSNDTTVDASGGANGEIGAIAIEIKAAVVAVSSSVISDLVIFE